MPLPEKDKVVRDLKERTVLAVAEIASAFSLGDGGFKLSGNIRLNHLEGYRLHAVKDVEDRKSP